MKQLLSLVALFGATMLGALAVPAASPRAQVMDTPPGCEWHDAGGGNQDLWCRDPEGRAYRTDTHRHDMGGSMEVCRRGELDDGMGCTSEAEARRSQVFGPQYDPSVNAPPPFDPKTAKTSTGKWRDPSRPDAVIVDGGRRHHRYGYVIPTPD